MFCLTQEFLASTQKTYGAELASVDFLRASEEARKAINEWVKEQTEGERGRPVIHAGPRLPPPAAPLRAPLSSALPTLQPDPAPRSYPGPDSFFIFIFLSFLGPFLQQHLEAPRLGV